LKIKKKHQIGIARKNSCQKILFTINNPDIKQGDVEVEEINMDSDIEGEEIKEGYHSIEPSNICSIDKIDPLALNSNEAFTVPKSMSVNNKDHCKGPNIFLLRDRILGKSKDSQQSCMEAVRILVRTDIENRNKVNFKTVLEYLAKNMDKIKHQTVLHRVIELLQFKGDSSLIKTLESLINKGHRAKSPQDAYLEHYDRHLIS